MPSMVTKMSWKGWLALASRYHLCLLSWPDTIPCPGPRFDFSKLVTSQLLALAQPFIDREAEDQDGGLAVTIEKWSEGECFMCWFEHV